MGFFHTLNCRTKADLLVIVGFEPLSHTSIITQQKVIGEIGKFSFQSGLELMTTHMIMIDEVLTK